MMHCKMGKVVTVTDIANQLLNTGKYNKKTLSEELGISRPTLDARLSGVSEWKKLEKNYLKLLVR